MTKNAKIKDGSVTPLTLDSQPWPTEDDKKIHWSQMFKVHPAAAVFPMLSDDELNKLAEDIKANGLQAQPVFWAASSKDPLYLLDGRNRLEALMRANIGDGLTSGATGWFCTHGKVFNGNEIDPVSYVIAANIKRRHLTKQQQAELIVAARKAEEKIDLPKIGKSISRNEKGQLLGSTKNPVREKVMQDAAAQGISEKTARSAWTNAEKTDVANVAKSVSESTNATQEAKPKKPKKWKSPVDVSSPKKDRIAAVWEFMAYLKLKVEDLDK